MMAKGITATESQNGTGNQFTQRSLALDALRGFAILTMVLSGLVPFGVLPSWMYHAQIPPPTHQFNPNLPGLTWVDLVFPFFLFSLGAAIPLALGKLLDKGTGLGSIVRRILERGFLLGFFAILLPHLRPDAISQPPGTPANLLGILGFLVMFAIFTRFPSSWKPWLCKLIRAAGWVTAILLLYLLDYTDGKGFSLYRNNIILVVLTNVYIFGALIWLVTRNNMYMRLGVLGILAALRLAQTEPGWVSSVWNFSPIPWIYKLYYLQYLFIVIPGTIIGDFIKCQQNSPHGKDTWPDGRNLGILLMSLALIPISLVGLHGRWVTPTATVAFITGLALVLLTTKSASSREKLIRDFCLWGFYFMALGYILEPFEGGIKKDKSTLSYYMLTAGLAIYLLNVFIIIDEYFKKGDYLKLLSENGQNPMIAYVGVAHFILPVLALAGLQDVIQALTATPWAGVLRAIGYTLLLAWMVRFFTRRNIFWRT